MTRYTCLTQITDTYLREQGPLNKERNVLATFCSGTDVYWVGNWIAGRIAI